MYVCVILLNISTHVLMCAPVCVFTSVCVCVCE